MQSEHFSEFWLSGFAGYFRYSPDIFLCIKKLAVVLGIKTRATFLCNNALSVPPPNQALGRAIDGGARGPVDLGFARTGAAAENRARGAGSSPT
jgi:hypothetical protein